MAKSCGRCSAGDLKPRRPCDLTGETSPPHRVPKNHHVLVPPERLVAQALQGSKPEQPRPVAFEKNRGGLDVGRFVARAYFAKGAKPHTRDHRTPRRRPKSPTPLPMASTVRDINSRVFGTSFAQAPEKQPESPRNALPTHQMQSPGRTECARNRSADLVTGLRLLIPSDGKDVRTGNVLVRPAWCRGGRIDIPTCSLNTVSGSKRRKVCALTGSDGKREPWLSEPLRADAPTSPRVGACAGRLSLGRSAESGGASRLSMRKPRRALGVRRYALTTTVAHRDARFIDGSLKIVSRDRPCRRSAATEARDAATGAIAHRALLSPPLGRPGRISRAEHRAAMLKAPSMHLDAWPEGSPFPWTGRITLERGRQPTFNGFNQCKEINFRVSRPQTRAIASLSCRQLPVDRFPHLNALDRPGDRVPLRRASMPSARNLSSILDGLDAHLWPKAAPGRNPSG